MIDDRDGPHPFLDAISYERALRKLFEDDTLVLGLSEIAHYHKKHAAWFPVTLPSYVVVTLLDNVLGKALAAERRKVRASAIEAERKMARDRQA